MQKVNRYYVVLSKRGIAVDELDCKFVRGSYLISTLIAQIDRQTFFWGIESVTDGIKIFDPKYVAKSSSMWRLEFQSTKPLKSILFYSTKR
jgi:hypothetical protein